MFEDRDQAGERLAVALEVLGPEDPVVLGLPRGGVPVADAVARALGAPLDVVLVRKLGAPMQPELAMGAIGEDGVEVLDAEVCRAVRARDEDIARIGSLERAELERRAALFRAVAPRLDLRGRVAVIVDDGIATGSTAKAACLVARAQGARRVVLAAPVAPPDVRSRFAGVADEVVVLETPPGFRAVGFHYSDFTQVTDEAVVDILGRAALRRARTAASGDQPPGVTR